MKPEVLHQVDLLTEGEIGSAVGGFCKNNDSPLWLIYLV